MHVLVTGGAGFIGSTVVDRLIAHDHKVTVVDDLSSGALANLEQARRDAKIGFHRFDVRSDGLRDLVVGARPDVVIHMAAQPSVPVSVAHPIQDASINIVGLLNVLEACVAAGVGRVVFAQSGGAMYGPQRKFPVPETARPSPTSPYGIAKHTAEHYLRFYHSRHGLDFVSLALANVYGPRQTPEAEAGVVATFASKVVMREPATIYGTGLVTRDFVYVDDVAHAFVLACERASAQTLNIGTGISTTINMLFKMIAEAAQIPSEAQYGPPRPGDVPDNALDPSKAVQTLGWSPWTPLSDGLRSTVAWVRSELKATGRLA